MRTDGSPGRENGVPGPRSDPGFIISTFRNAPQRCGVISRYQTLREFAQSSESEDVTGSFPGKGLRHGRQSFFS